jgi:arylsulfatase A-like enzyme/thioredoxin-like negative regulator of GroEL
MNTKGIVPALLASMLVVACGTPRPAERDASTTAAPSILLVTMDTTRADSIGPEAAGVETPSFNALAARGQRFRAAYATVPETLPSHASLLTGLYPAGHGVHENARTLPASHPVLAEQLQKSGYHTAAFVSSFVLARRFGLARGFDSYDDEQPAGQSERTAVETTAAALAELRRPSTKRRFLWVHYFDPHAPYAPPEPFRSRYARSPYLGEVALMDRELGRLVSAFDEQAARDGHAAAIIVVGDHGEGLGEHGESQHGHLLYQSTMHVPLVVVAPGVAAGVSDGPVSTRRVYHTVLSLAGLSTRDSLIPASPPVARGAGDAVAQRGGSGGAHGEVVLGEAMKPFLEYGWQPQVMSIEGASKTILAGRIETYDLKSDPKEQRNLGGGANIPARVQAALDDYPLPSPERARLAETLDADARERLASLGYVSAGAAPPVRKDAPRPADMIPVMEMLEKASGLFVNEQYGAVVPLLENILLRDPQNLDATLRLATAHSALGHETQAIAAFAKARAIAPRSEDVDLYLALHYARGRGWERALPLLERIVTQSPDRVPAIEALAALRERQGRTADAIVLRQKLYALKAPSPAELLRLGELAMSAGQTAVAIDAFEKARSIQGGGFRHELELGVLYLAARRLEDAKAALDRVPGSSAEYPMALFKRAQVSVLLREPDREARIAAARQHADSTTGPLIAGERLFQEGRRP